MGIESRWIDATEANDIKVVIYDYVGEWNWDEFHQQHKDTVAAIESQSIRVYPIVNLGTNNHLPPSALSHLTKNPLMTHDRVIRVILVIDNPFIRVIANMVTKLAGFQTPPRFFKTLDAAQKWIAEDIASRQTSA